MFLRATASGPFAFLNANRQRNAELVQRGKLSLRLLQAPLNVHDSRSGRTNRRVHL